MLNSYLLSTYIHTITLETANIPDRKNCHVVNTVLKYAHVKENAPKSSTEIFSNVWAETTKID